MQTKSDNIEILKSRLDEKARDELINAGASVGAGASINRNSIKWEAPIPFDDMEVPAFPLDCLPPATREYIMAAAETIQAPVDMVGPCVMGILQIACRGRYPVRLPNGHVERPCFYIAPILPPSERKSGVISTVSLPVTDYETEYNRDHGGDLNQNRSELKLLQSKIANTEQQIIKEKDSAKRRAAEIELQGLNAELAEFEQLEPLRLMGADVTPEKLAAMLKSQKGTFALVSAEGGGIFENIGRYSDKGGMEIYLNGYSGDRVCVDRKTSDSIVIDSPTLSIIAPCQPLVITDLFSDRQKSGRGLLSRVQFIKCRSRVGGREPTSEPLGERIAQNYKNLCYAMLDASGEGKLTYDKDGFSVYCQLFNEIEPQLTPEVGDLAFMADWAGKLHGLMTRLAGLIHCIAAFEKGKNPLDTQINANEAIAAATLARFFLGHAKAVYMEQAEPQSIANARYLWDRLKAVESISKRELIRKTHGKQAFDLDDSLTLLAERSYVRVVYAQTGGRPAETVIINPEAKNMVTKVTKAPGIDPLDTKVTIPAHIPYAKTDVPPDEGENNTSGDVPGPPPVIKAPLLPERHTGQALLRGEF